MCSRPSDSLRLNLGENLPSPRLPSLFKVALLVVQIVVWDTSSLAAVVTGVDVAAHHDIVYLSPARQGWEGLPLGNGTFGAQVWQPDEMMFQLNTPLAGALTGPQAQPFQHGLWSLRLVHKAVRRKVLVLLVVNRFSVRRLLRPAPIPEQLLHVHLVSDFC
jgi:hypothetical protein